MNMEYLFVVKMKGTNITVLLPSFMEEVDNNEIS